jgi:hypothetical protein
MAKKDKAAAPVKVAAKKEEYKSAISVPAGNPDRHIIRLANRTWIVTQPGNKVFIGQFPTKEDAMKMATRHTALTKGKVVCHD